MKRFGILAVVAVLTLPACSRPKVYAAAAPAGALGCALRQASNLGYQPIAGGVGDGYIKFGKQNPYRVSDAGKEAALRVASLGMKGNNRLEWDHITATEAGNMLRLQVVGIYENNKAGAPSRDAEVHAQGILSGCATPSDVIR